MYIRIVFNPPVHEVYKLGLTSTTLCYIYHEKDNYEIQLGLENLDVMNSDQMLTAWFPGWISGRH